MPLFLQEEHEQLHREFLQLDPAAGAEQLVAVAVKLKLVEFDDLGGQSGRHFLDAEYNIALPDHQEVP